VFSLTLRNAVPPLPIFRCIPLLTARPQISDVLATDAAPFQ
jgi:hypothetical protein